MAARRQMPPDRDRYTAEADSRWQPPYHPRQSGPRRFLSANGAGDTVGRVLVLNATYEPINVCTVQARRRVPAQGQGRGDRARRITAALGHADDVTASRDRLVSYVRIPRDTHRRKITRRAVFARDDWTCQYCGSRFQPHRRPRGPALQRRLLQLGQHRRLLCPVQPSQGQHAPASIRNAASADSRGTPESPHVFIQVASPTIPAAWRDLPGRLSGGDERRAGAPGPGGRAGTRALRRA